MNYSFYKDRMSNFETWIGRIVNAYTLDDNKYQLCLRKGVFLIYLYL